MSRLENSTVLMISSMSIVFKEEIFGVKTIMGRSPFWFNGNNFPIGNKKRR